MLSNAFRITYFHRSTLYATIIVIALTNLKTSGIPLQCPNWINEEIQRCMKSVAEYAQLLNEKQNTSGVRQSPEHSEFSQALQLPKIEKQMFRELCRRINDFKTCVSGYRDQCQKHITIDLIESSYGYLCNEGFEAFMASADCLIDLDQQPSVKRCHDKTLKEIESVNSLGEANVLTKLNRMCEALNFFSSCVQHPIRSGCGVAAWHVIFHVLKGTTRTLLPICQFNGESSNLRHHTPRTRSHEDSPSTSKTTPRSTTATTGTTPFWIPRRIQQVEKDTEWVPVDTEDFFLESTRQPAEEAAPTPRNPTPPGLPNIEIEISQLYPEEMMTEPEEEVSRQNFAHSIGHINGWTSAATRQIIQLLHTALLAICCTLYHVIHRNFEL